MRLTKSFLIIFLGLSLQALAGEPASAVAVATAGGLSSTEILNRYFSALEKQQKSVEQVSMDVDIDAQLPRLKKTGSLHALRRVSRLGQVTYDGVRFLGDKMIKKDVIARYLTAETEAQNVRAESNGAPDAGAEAALNGEKNGGKNGNGKTSKLGSVAINTDNYKFKFKGTAEHDSRSVYVFQLSPKKKRVGLFKGDLWIDPDTFLPVRESGRFVKNPSIFLKKVEFVRSYQIRDGLALPVEVSSRIETRIVGRAELNIRFSNIAVLSGESRAAMACPVGYWEN